MRVRLVIEYDGTNYVGWQVQPNGVSVQQVIEQTFERVYGEKINLVGSGRTDSGVHALGQVAHFDTQLNIPAQSFSHGLNGKLPDDIKILSSVEASVDFHARFTAKRKTYRYNIYVSNFIKPLSERYAVRVNPGLNVEKMINGAKLIEGEHDFVSFCASGSAVKNTVRRVDKIEVIVKGNEISFLVTGSGFLYNMVRIIVGTLLALGYEKITENHVISALNGKNREVLGKTMPAKGLTLMSVEYD